MSSLPLVTKPISIGNCTPYQNRWYGACGAISHQLLDFAGACGLKALQVADWTVNGQNKAIIDFADQVKNLHPEDACFTLDMESERQTINRLQLNKSRLNTICAIAINVGILTATAPLSIPSAAIAIGLRALVQNHMADVAIKLNPNPKIWNGTDPITITTFNVAMTEFKIMDWFNGVAGTEERVKKLARWIDEKKSDFFCLQEAFDIDKIWNAFKDNLVIASKRKCTFGMTGGVAFISRYKVIETAYHEFSRLEGVDAYTRKGVLACKVELAPGKVIAIGVTHMQAGYSSGSPEQKSAWTKAQFEEGKNFLLEFAEDVQDVFFVGDYNVGRFDTGDQPNLAQIKGEYQGMCEGLLQDFKDLTIPNVNDSFMQARHNEVHFDVDSPYNQETGEARGSVFNTEAPSYHFFKELIYLKVRPDLPDMKASILKISIEKRLANQPLLNPYASFLIDEAINKHFETMYRKPLTCDHVSLFAKEDNLFSETGYDYARDNVLLSDHIPLTLTIKPK